MKDDLISRTALITAFLSRQKTEDEVKHHTIPAEDVISLIQNAPAAGPSKKHWIPFGTGRGSFLCSGCNGNSIMDTNFCPFCGADMRESNKAQREAEEEARREAMRLDDFEDTAKWRGHA